LEETEPACEVERNVFCYMAGQIEASITNRNSSGTIFSVVYVNADV
jgi:hypothetical protein